ncbi:MAG: hypothetical protein IPJ41_17015 [Phycisphaerales bacterium]|nr:hypothetical protein [Phycisphaerales bacterium]
MQTTDGEGHDHYAWTTDGPGAVIPSPGWQSLFFPYNAGGYYPCGGDASVFSYPSLPWHYPQTETVVPFGFRLNRAPMASPAPGDFLPVGHDLAEHSTCLLPPGGSAISTDWQGSFRPTLDRKVDLVTGLPLVQVTDLELPFGGATFRLTRTRSGMRPDALPPPGMLSQRVSAPDAWWDWAGMGWMLSENPLLVIDSALPDVTGDQPYTSWFIVDAHHSIPFQLIEATGVYEAPPRFRSRMTHDGEWGVVATKADGKHIYGWVDRPKQYDIFLYDGALHYTFVALWEDVPPNLWDSSILGGGGGIVESSFHDRPLLPDALNDPQHSPWTSDVNPGIGLPYYGLCTKVEDQYGHRVDIEYCSVLGAQMDDSSTADCVECMRRTVQKGQIRDIKLSTRGEVQWTLLYAHRMFAGLQLGADGFYDNIDLRYQWDGNGQQPNGYEGFGWVPSQYSDDPDDPTPGRYQPQYFDLHGHVALDRILVYKGELSGALLDAVEPFLTIPHTDTGSLDDSGMDPLVEYAEHKDAGDPELGTDWAFKLRYYYDINTNTGRPLSPPLLIREETLTAHGAGAPTSANRVYQYDLNEALLCSHWSQLYADGGNLWDAEELYPIPWLRFIFDDEGLNRLAEDWDKPGTWQSGSIPGNFDLTLLGRNRRSDNPGALNDDESGAFARTLSRYASVEYGSFDSESWPAAGGPEAPDIEKLTTSPGQQLFEDRTRLSGDNIGGLVHDLAYTDETGARRYFRINRVCHVPPAIAGGGFDPGFWLDQWPATDAQRTSRTPTTGNPMPQTTRRPLDW